MTNPPTPSKPEDVAVLRQIPALLGHALDTGATGLLSDVLDADVVVDLTPAAEVLGLDLPVLIGRETVVQTATGGAGPVATEHVVSTVALRRTGARYTVDAHVVAWYQLPDQDIRPAPVRRAQLGFHWTFQVRHDDEGLHVTHVAVDCTWFDGDATVLLAVLRVTDADGGNPDTSGFLARLRSRLAPVPERTGDPWNA
ncbi:nuclear transport factor 2 family protein [Jatrophihabitans sp. YIM 134969]